MGKDGNAEYPFIGAGGYTTVDSEDRKFILTIGVIAIIIVGGYAGLAAYTGFSTPFSVVMSESMQHDNTRSEIGCIDTGDVVIVRSPDKTEPVSYIQALKTGYKTFGDYGSVIIYERGNGYNPVIHRAIIWVDWNASTGSWSAPSLADYSGRWDCTSGHDCMDLRGTLRLYDITQSEKDIAIDLDRLGRNSGFITMGDNPVTNTSIDQPGTIDHPVSMEEIRSIPIAEIPWIGTMKILLKKNGENLEKVPNSLPSLTMSFLFIVSLLLIVDIISMNRSNRELRSDLERMRRKY